MTVGADVRVGTAAFSCELQLIWSYAIAPLAQCIAIEMECVAAKVAAEITKRTKMLVFSMGSGAECDGQFVFAEDLLGSHKDHYPRHSITYGHMYADAVEGLRQYKADVQSGTYPTAKHSIAMKGAEFAAFMELIGKDR